MCFDTNMCVSSVTEHLICPICLNIFCFDSVVDNEGHTFCKKCIIEWLSRNPSCPQDRKPMKPQDLRTIPYPLIDIIKDLKFRCIYLRHGCTEEIKLENIKTHEENCKYKNGNPLASAPEEPLSISKNPDLRKEMINKSLAPYITLKLNNNAKNHLITSLDEIRRLNTITRRFLNRNLRLNEVAVDFLTLNSPDQNLLTDILTGNKSQLLTCRLPAISTRNLEWSDVQSYEMRDRETMNKRADEIFEKKGKLFVIVLAEENCNILSVKIDIGFILYFNDTHDN